MVIERNEASFGRTRAARKKTLEEIVAKVRQVLGGAEAADRVRGVLFVALVEDAKGGLHAQEAATCYGKAGLAALQSKIEETLLTIGRQIQAAEQARDEARVKGRRWQS